MLVVKQCKCTSPMYIHERADEIIFSGCEPTLVNVKIKKVKEDEIELTATRSAKRVRCTNCRRISLRAAFEEVKDGNATEEGSS